MLILSVLLRYMYGFYGYGNWCARYWFIGIEESCPGQQEDVRQRVTVWDGNPQALWDMVDYHQALNAAHVFQRRQRTWAGIAAFLFGMRNQNFTSDDLIAYQRQLGRVTDPETCLMELQPLPSPRVWHYGSYRYDVSTPDFLTTRESCLDECGMDRAKYIRDRLTGLDCPPKFILFYGKPGGRRFRAMRNLIVQQPLCRDQPIHIGATWFLLLNHPADNAAGIGRFHNWGRQMQQLDPNII